MFSTISNRVRGWMNRTEPPLDHQQQAGNPINDQLNTLSINSENETKVDANKNGNHNGSNSEKRDNVENLQAEKEGGFENERIFEAEDSSHVHQVGVNLKTNHPADRKPQAGKVNEKDDSKSEQIDCNKFDYPFGSNAAKVRRANRRKKPSPKVEYNFMGLPIRQGEKDCSEFMSHGSCESGVECRFNHPDPTSVEGSEGQSSHCNEGPIPQCFPLRFPSTLGPSNSTAFDNRPPLLSVPLRFPSNLGFSSPPAFDNCPPPPPSFPLRFPSNLGPSPPPVGFNQCPSYGPMMFPPTQGATCLPESQPYQAPVHLPESFVQMPPVYATNSQPPERDIYAHQRPPILVDEFPQRPGQPECSYFLKTGNCTYGSACRFHHPKNRSAKSTASGHGVSGPPIRPPMQPFIPKAVVPPSRDASFSKKFAGQNSGLNATKSNPKQPKATPKKGSSNSSVRCDLCGVECPDIQNYNKHLTGKKHTSNLQQLHASRTSLEAKPADSMDQSCTSNQMSNPSAEDIVVSNLETKEKKVYSGSEVAIPCGKGTSGITNVASDLKANMQKSGDAIERDPCANVEGSAASLVTDFEAKTQESCSAEGIGASGWDDLAADTSVSDLEAKKQKLLVSGIAVQSLRTCTLCNVVCNGETAFAEHLRGKKHLAKCEQDCSLNSLGSPSVEASDSQSGHSIQGSVVSPTASQSKPGFSPPVSRCPPNIPLLSTEGVLYWPECSYSLKTGRRLCDSPCKFHHPENNWAKLTPEQDLAASVTNSDPASVTNPKSKEEDVNKKTNNQQFVWCEVCKVRCTSLKGLMHHEQGKKHKMNVEKSQTLMTGSPSKDSGVDCWSIHPDPTSDVQSEHSNEGFVVSPIDSQSKPGPLFPGVSQYPPNVPSLSTDGVLHWPEQLPCEEQVRVASVTDSDPASVTNPNPKSAEEVSKKTNNDQFVWCQVCKIRCTSIADLKYHEQGKKHKSNEEAAKKTNNSTPPTSCEICKMNFTCAESLKNHKYGKKHRANVEKLLENAKTDPTLFKDLEAKKQKVLEHGAPADAVKICIYCNVVCTSEKMYNNHVASTKHVAAVLKLKQVAETGSWTELSTAG